MANVKITELTAATALTGTDVLPIVDVGADATKKVSVSDLLRNLPDGSAASPSLAFADDQNTGVLSPGNNSLAFATSGTQRLVIDSSGNVAIGNTSADARLHIEEASPTDGVLLKLNNDVNSSGSQAGLRIRHNDTSQLECNLLTERTGLNAGLDFKIELSNSSGTVTERLRVDEDGKVGIGTSNPATILHLAQAGIPKIRIEDTDTNGGVVDISANGAAGFIDVEDDDGTSGTLVYRSPATTERLRIDSSGRLLIGTSSARTINTFTPSLQVEGTTADNASITVIRHSTGTGGSRLLFGKSRGNTDGSTTLVSSGDPLGEIAFAGADGTDFASLGGSIKCLVDGTPGANDMPGRLVFFTTADGASSPTERMRIDSNGVLISSHATINGGVIGTNGNELRFQSDINANGTPFTSFYTGSSERMRIDSAGRLLVGTTTSSNNTRLDQKLAIVNADSSSTSHTGINITNYSNRQLVCPVIDLKKSRSNSDGGFTVVQNNDVLGYIVFQGTDGDQFVRAAEISALVDGTPGNNDMPGRLVFSTTADGADSPTERARISSNGRFSAFGTSISHVFRVSQTSSADTAFVVNNNATSTTDGTLKFVVRADGDAENTNNSYGALSDAKLKENIVDAGSQWDDIKNIRVRNYNFIEGDTHRQIGVVAQEVETVSPGLVKERKDIDAEGNTLGTTTKAVNYSVLYMKAVKALQEAMDRIETLEAKVAALEAQ